MTEGVIDCAVATLAAKKVRKVKRRGNTEVKKGEERVREGKIESLVVFIFLF
jgi:hypothetical protein